MNKTDYDELDKTTLLASDVLAQTNRDATYTVVKNRRNKYSVERKHLVDINHNTFTQIRGDEDKYISGSDRSKSTVKPQSPAKRNSKIRTGRFAGEHSTPKAVYLNRQITEEESDTVCLILNDHSQLSSIPYIDAKSEQTNSDSYSTHEQINLLFENCSPQAGLHCPPALTMNLSFAGCGFLGIYHLGVAKALACHGRRLLMNVQHFTGASAGILVASVLAIKGADMDAINKCSDFTFNLARKAKKKSFGVLTPRFSLLTPLEDFLTEICPEGGAEIASGRLHVSLTKLKNRKNITVSHFHSNEHLIQCLLASSYIPFVTGTNIFTIEGEKYLDGGLTDNLPVLPHGRTVTVSPFCGKEDVCPVDTHRKGFYTHMGNMSVQVTPDNMKRGMHAFFPPDHGSLRKYEDRGYSDAVKFLKKEGYYEC